MKKSVALVSIIVAGLVLSACTHTASTTNTTTTGTTTTVGAPAADQKSGDTTKTGVISEAGGKFFLQEAGSTPQMIESYAVDLSQYVGQTVTVTGQYSGDTLFVGSVQ